MASFNRSLRTSVCALNVYDNIVAAAKRRNMGVDFVRAAKGERDTVVKVVFTEAKVDSAPVEASD